MFVLLFVYVFGGAIAVPGGGSYVDYLMPGIFVQTLTFAAATTAIGMADDSHKGIIDRFRSLPMARSAVLSGRSVADVVYNALILVVLMITGLVVGWRIDSSLPESLAGIALLLGFAFAMSWLGIVLGLSVPSVEVAQQAVFIVLFPLTFVSSAFVPVATLPSWLQPFAEWNPITVITYATRDLFGNPNPTLGGGLPAEYPIPLSIAWIVAIVLVFAPLAVRRYSRLDR
jgi:ABC transporter DrrB family efflux protein